MTKLEILKSYFGHDSFREGQEGIIDALLSGRDILAVMPTGAGKSMCYQIPALMSDGVAIVVSPLISLMKDQVNALIQSGVRAAYINSSLSYAQCETALRLACDGRYKIVYAAPERLCTPSFLHFARRVKISLIAVDEAHCVSQWGQDFRPSYMRIPEFVAQLSYRPPIAAFTATATNEVKTDIANMLGLHEPYSVTTGFDRENLYFEVRHPSDKFLETVSILKANKDKSGIIYCSTRKNVEEVCQRLNRMGIACTRYHAGLDDEERRKNQDDFIYDRVQVITATNAFGMGIDKSNVSFVIHYNMPKNIESYYQEAGRAGRDGENAQCILLFGEHDISTNTFLIENQNENAEIDAPTAAMLKERDMQRLREMIFYCTTTTCLREYILRYFGEKPKGFCANCSNCNSEFEETDITIDAQKILSCIYRLQQRRLSFGASMITAILRGSKNAKIQTLSLDTLSTYGIMKDTPSAKIKREINYLEEIGCIKRQGQYSVMVLMRDAADVLSGNRTLTMKLPKEKEKAISPIRPKKESDTIFTYDKELFAELKDLRLKLAAKAGVPAYIIFPDKTLRDICVRLPKTETQLLDCSGIGQAKLANYGTDILSVVKAFLEKKPSAGFARDITPKDIEKSDGRTGLFYLIRNNHSKLSPADENLTLSGLCERIFECLGISADKMQVKSALEKWLLENNYLAKNDEKSATLKTTILSDEIGIEEIQKTSKSGAVYTSIVFPKEAQEFIFGYTNEIFA